MKIRFKTGVHEFPNSVAMGFIRGKLAEEVKDEPEPIEQPEGGKDWQKSREGHPAPPSHPAPKAAGKVKEEPEPVEAEKKEDKPAAPEKRKGKSTVVRPAGK